MNVTVQNSLEASLKGFVSRGVRAVELDASGHLIFTLTDNSTADLGLIIMPGIAAAEIDESGHLVLTLTDDSVLDLGQVVADEGLHAATHAAGGTDAVSPASIGAAASAHTHAQGDVTGLADALSGKAAASHASTHATGGADAITPAAIGAQPALGSGDVTAAMLAANAVSTTYTATVATGWSGDTAPYSKATTISGLLATDTPIIDLVPSATYATAEAQIEAWGYVYRAVATANTLTLYAADKPTVALPVQVKAVRK